MGLSTKETNSAVVFKRGPYAVGVHRFPVNLRGIERLTVQWSAFSEDATATGAIRFFIGTVDENCVQGVANPLADTDPATNKFWSPLTNEDGSDVVFASEPAGAVDSEALQLPTPGMHSICGTQLLIELTVGVVDLTDFLISVRSST